MFLPSCIECLIGYVGVTGFQRRMEKNERIGNDRKSSVVAIHNFCLDGSELSNRRVVSSVTRNKPITRVKGKIRGTIWHFQSEKEFKKWQDENWAIERDLVIIPRGFFE